MIKFSEGKLLIIEGSIDISWKNDNSFLLYLTINKNLDEIIPINSSFIC